MNQPYLKYMRSFAVDCSDLEFVQAVLAQLTSIEQIERELQGGDV